MARAVRDNLLFGRVVGWQVDVFSAESDSQRVAWQTVDVSLPFCLGCTWQILLAWNLRLPLMRPWSQRSTDVDVA